MAATKKATARKAAAPRKRSMSNDRSVEAAETPAPPPGGVTQPLSPQTPETTIDGQPMKQDGTRSGPAAGPSPDAGFTTYEPETRPAEQDRRTPVDDS